MSRIRIKPNIAYDDTKQKYYVYFDMGRDAAGARLRPTKTYGTLQEAEEAFYRFQLQQSRIPSPSAVTVGQWVLYWLEDIIRPNRARTTYYGYRCIVRNHVIPLLGSTPLQALTPNQIQQYYTTLMRDQGLSANSVRKHHILLHSALKTAVRQDLLFVNPTERVDPPRETFSVPHFYNARQLKLLFDLAEGTRLELPVKLAGYLGLRRSEICGLKWSCTDLENQLVAIRTVRTVAGKMIVEKGTKTVSSTRTLSIAGLDDLILTLKREKQAQARRMLELGDRYCDGDYVLASPDGHPWNPNVLSSRFSKFVQKHELPPITIHGLRHTFASLANNAHVPLFNIGKALGHSDPSITSRVYTHLLDQSHSEVLTVVAQCIQAVG